MKKEIFGIIKTTKLSSGYYVLICDYEGYVYTKHIHNYNSDEDLKGGEFISLEEAIKIFPELDMVEWWIENDWTGYANKSVQEIVRIIVQGSALG